jgi:hypothetical protein
MLVHLYHIDHLGRDKHIAPSAVIIFYADYSQPVAVSEDPIILRKYLRLNIREDLLPLGFKLRQPLVYLFDPLLDLFLLCQKTILFFLKP